MYLCDNVPNAKLIRKTLESFGISITSKLRLIRKTYLYKEL